jgi:hypothetical protein
MGVKKGSGDVRFGSIGRLLGVLSWEKFLSQEFRPMRFAIPIFFNQSIYPSAGSSANRSLIYWRTIAVLCASLKRANIRNLEVLVCTNEVPPLGVAELLRELGVYFVSPPFSFQPPAGLFPAFSGAFYLFDCMDYCQRTFKADEIFVFIDPDCLVMNNLEILRRCSKQWPVIGYELEIARNYKVNGCSPNDLLGFLSLMGREIAEPPKYFGGEFLMVTKERLDELCEIIKRVWRCNLDNFQSGKATLKTEEHVISVALALMSEQAGTANKVVKRMWTRPSFRNASVEDRQFSVWHLPAEKRFAFQELFHLLQKNVKKLLDLSDEEFCNLVAELVRLELSFLERPVYFFYPFLKKSIKRLVEVAREPIVVG